jgi:hypothetical protein
MNKIYQGIVLGGVIVVNWSYIVGEKQIPQPDYNLPPYSIRSASEFLTREINVTSAAISPTVMRVSSSDWTKMAITGEEFFVRLV